MAISWQLMQAFVLSNTGELTNLSNVIDNVSITLNYIVDRLLKN